MNLTGTRTIETHRLILRRFTIEDAEDMYNNWASDPEVTKFLTWPTHTSVEVSRMVLSDWIPRYEDGGYFNWAMEWKETGHVIGNISVVKLNEAAESADIGYCMSRAYWGRGIMPEALRAVMGFLFETVGVNRVAACHAPENPKSGRVMAKAGMIEEGILRGAGRNNQGICDDVWHAMIRSDWEAERAGESAGEQASGSGEKTEDAAKKANQPILVRFAREEDLPRVNVLRKEVNDLHVAGKPDTFKPGFSDELRDYIFAIFADPMKKIVVAELCGTVCGFAVLNHITRPETPFMYVRDYLDVDEFGVDRDFRRRGAASAMIRFIRDYAVEQGFRKLELNMWEFNRSALAFYETAGFDTYRRYMEMKLED
ncbi:MAG: GNAT family N-acetyltransferase [Lachnospiraceae bacterium]|nr:GNAT family N-acetyltransferase [Lachnospiraceae bacterium]